MKKILIEYNYILHYRKPFFNMLAKNYEVTVLHSGEKTVLETDNYKEVIVPVKKIGPLYFQSGVYSEIRKDYDYIIILFDVRWVNSLFCLPFHKKKSKTILWGAWITKSNFANKLRLYLSKKAYANVFYTYASKKDFINHGLEDKNLYVANNTFHVIDRIKAYESDNKNCILFVGSLDKRKQNDTLLKAFSKIIDKISLDINIKIIGTGEELQNLKQLSKDLKIEDRVNFVGRINDSNLLKEHYESAIVNVSFGQAGLSVLQSLGYGVPFLTKKNAISGGEIFNIKNNLSGILCDDNQQSLEEKLLLLCTDINYSKTLGKQAWDYYSKYCTMENMTQGFIDAIEKTKLSEIDINSY